MPESPKHCKLNLKTYQHKYCKTVCVCVRENSFISSNKELFHQAVYSIRRPQLCINQTLAVCVFVVSIPVETYSLEFIAVIAQ